MNTKTKFNEALHLHNVREKNNRADAARSANRTIIIDLSNVQQSDIAPTLLGAAQGMNAPWYWGSNALYVALNPALAQHRDYEAAVRGVLPVRKQH